MGIQKPTWEELSPEYLKVLDRQNPKALFLVARGVSPVPPSILIPAWVLLKDYSDPAIAEVAKQSLLQAPDVMWRAALQGDLPEWAIYELGLMFRDHDAIVEKLLLHPHCPTELYLALASTVKESLTQVIAQNQEQIIECPKIILELEKNPLNLMSTTDRLRQFLYLAGIDVPPRVMTIKKEVIEVNPEPLVSEIENIEKPVGDDEVLTEEKKLTLQQYIMTLNIGGKVKLGMKGNKEARSILIKDSNKVVSIAVLKSPKMTDNEVVHYSAMKSLADDVVRTIAENVAWVKHYGVKVGLLHNPKTPLVHSMRLLKFLNIKDLKNLGNSKDIPGPLQKAIKELIRQKAK